jgi:hypothetical protein
MFGNTDLDENFVSEDEDWGPKRRRRRTIPDAPNRPRPTKVQRRALSADPDRNEGQLNPSSGSQGDGGVGEEGEKRVWRRLPDTAVEVHIIHELCFSWCVSKCLKCRPHSFRLRSGQAKSFC